METDILQTLWAVLTNANVIYLLLIIGLWTAAAAFYVPGTGLLEALAVICLVVAIAGLTRQPANIVGLALIVAVGALCVVDHVRLPCGIHGHAGVVHQAAAG